MESPTAERTHTELWVFRFYAYWNWAADDWCYIAHWTVLNTCYDPIKRGQQHAPFIFLYPLLQPFGLCDYGGHLLDPRHDPPLLG
ncbi:MAG: hypothetical protein ACREYE_17960 [Gammaproteobacteria bacterium]